METQTILIALLAVLAAAVAVLAVCVGLADALL